jgi:hypothetical protein
MLFEVLDDFASGLPESWSKANPKIAKSQMNPEYVGLRRRRGRLVPIANRRLIVWIDAAAHRC